MDGNKLLTNVSSKFGAPMGRVTITEDTAAKVRLFRVRLVDGDYDVGGAYWGGGQGTLPLYAAIGEGFQAFCRAIDRDEARKKMREKYPDLRFYR